MDRTEAKMYFKEIMKYCIDKGMDVDKIPELNKIVCNALEREE